MKALYMIEWKKGINSELFRNSLFLVLIVAGNVVPVVNAIIWLGIIFIGRKFPDPQYRLENILPFNDKMRFKFVVVSRLLFYIFAIVIFNAIFLSRNEGMFMVIKNTEILGLLLALDLVVATGSSYGDNTPKRYGWISALIVIAEIVMIFLTHNTYWPMERFVIRCAFTVGVVLIALVINYKKYRKYGYGIVQTKGGLWYERTGY